MINNISSKIVGKMIDNSIINNADRELYLYGFFILLSQILYFIFTIIFSSILGVVFEGVIFYVTFQFIRLYAGGIHASCELKCEVATTVSLLLCLGFIKICNLYNIKIVILIVTMVAAVFIFILCPLDTPEKPLNKKEKVYFRKKSWIILFIILTIIGISSYFEINTLIYPCSMSLILESILLILGKIKEIRKKNG